jgi:GT2 family glycosyltransferase
MLSIIIPSFNTKSYTERCVGSVLTFPPAEPYDIILIDNASSDGTVEQIEAKFPSVKTRRMGYNSGFSKACNAGAKMSQGERLLFLNSDAEVLSGSLDRLTRWLNDHPRTGIAGPTLVNADGKIVQMSWGWDPVVPKEFLQKCLTPSPAAAHGFRARLIDSLQRKSKSVDFVSGASLMIRKKIFDELGGFDEQYELYFEDADLCRRARLAGWYVDFVAEAKVVHHSGQSPKPAGRLSLIYQQSHRTYYERHAGFLGKRSLHLYLLLKSLFAREGSANLRDVATAKRRFTLQTPPL